jgi:hypothetical protein
MPTISEIIVHPRTFLRANALWPSGELNRMALGRPDTFGAGSPGEGSRVWPVQLVPKSGVECKRSDGTLLPAWQIAPAASLGNTTLAYYLPWRPNSALHMVLGDKADFFITDAINGCTFAYGPGGNPRVAHLNYNTKDAMGDRVEGNPLDQAKIDKEIGKIFPGVAIATLKKADYNTDVFPNVTVIGVRRAGIWTFVYQSRDYIGARGPVAAYLFKSVHTVR